MAKEIQKEFYTLLAEELIDNTCDAAGLAARQRQPVHDADTSPSLAHGTGVPRGIILSYIHHSYHSYEKDESGSRHYYKASKARSVHTMWYEDNIMLL